jgi:hypothetical protein
VTNPDRLRECGRAGLTSGSEWTTVPQSNNLCLRTGLGEEEAISLRTHVPVAEKCNSPSAVCELGSTMQNRWLELPWGTCGAIEHQLRPLLTGGAAGE